MAVRLELGPGTGCYVKNPEIVEGSFSIPTAKPESDELAVRYLR
jgi:hypothetical protein